MRTLTKTFRVIFPLVLLIVAFGCQKGMKDDSANLKGSPGSEFTPQELKNFVPVNLVGDNDAYKPWYVDANLVNAWGISFPPAGPAWVSSSGKGKSTIYNRDGLSVAAAVSIPRANTSDADHGTPTGHAYNPTSDFKLPNGNAAEFIFATADGTLSGWNSGSTAVTKIDNSPAASYLGVTMAAEGSDFFIYAANFAQNRVEVFDKNWNAVNKPFVDPGMPADYSPINIETLSDGKIYVMYAQKNADGKPAVGQGNGYINVFNPAGTLLKRFASKGKLNVPWGITIAPAGFWGGWSQLSGIILVGNNGDGRINAFDENGTHLGTLAAKGKAIEIDGLWGLAFPPINGLNRYYLYFAAGPNDGRNGLVGYIKNFYLN
jgi:uncharacterized protein (TIGR03118 family)